ncbi:MAG: 3-keto-5-aminohexanoate cleavage protein [Pseudomonadota bacterium]
MFARTDPSPLIMVAPKGARRSKADHPQLPLSIEEIRDETVACAHAGAKALHLHVRDETGAHALDAGLYREAIEEIHDALPGFPIQVTTESAGIFDVDAQFRCLRALRPEAASISVREIARSPDLAPEVYGFCEAESVAVQHILYDERDWHRLEAWRASGIVRRGQDDVIFVLGTYAPPKAASLEALRALAMLFEKNPGRSMVCAFGASEHKILRAAAALGADLRVGFENNIHEPDGTLAKSNAANVARLKSALSPLQTIGKAR